MLFQSQTFLVFFAVVFLVYWRLPHRAQNLFLLAASLFFYGSWNAAFLGLIIGSATIDYLCAAAIARSEDPRRRRLFLVLAIGASLAILGYFKYANFFVENFVALAQSLGVGVSRPVLNIILPVGISFHTFQSMSYTIDVYRRELVPCRRYLDFVLFVAFFPQLVAGPIERGRRLLPQVMNPRPPLRLGTTVEAVKLIVVGYAQKVAIADTLAPIADSVFARPAELDSLTLYVGLLAFAIQIYCDFAGYSNIARGTAKLLGFELMRNFAEPYLAPNITEFWRRWHISLSQWLRDYLYIPLGGKRRGAARTSLSVMATMRLGGLWHGASWNFVIWGGLHGVYLAAHKALGGGARARSSRLARFLGWLVTFHAELLAWIFFRAEGFARALDFVQGLAHGTARFSVEALEVAFYPALSFALDRLLRRSAGRPLLVLFSRRWALEASAVGLVILWILIVGVNDVVPFIYFQF